MSGVTDQGHFSEKFLQSCSAAVHNPMFCAFPQQSSDHSHMLCTYCAAGAMVVLTMIFQIDSSLIMTIFDQFVTELQTELVSSSGLPKAYVRTRAVTTGQQQINYAIGG
jgi:hypothetical protein